MVGMLFNNILYCFSDIYIISYILDFIIGNSITTTFLLYVCSYVFSFCKWHRFIITANIINLLIANLDAYYRIPISDIQVLKLGITLKQLIEFILDLLLRQYVFLNMLPLLLFIYLM